MRGAYTPVDRQSRCPRVRQGDCDGRYRSAKSTKQLLPPLSPRITNPRGPHYFEPTKWTEKERRLPNAGNCQEEKAKWHPAEWKKIFGTKRALVYRVLLSGFGRSRLSCELRRNSVRSGSKAHDIQTVSFGHIKSLVVLRSIAQMR